MSYRFLNDVSIADVAFEAKGKSVEEMFIASAMALTNTMIANIESIDQKVTKLVRINSEDLDMLLFNFLQELIFMKDTEQLIFSKFEVVIKSINGSYSLEAKLYGEKLNGAKHLQLVDVKAVTLHQFEVKQIRGVWKARVILDV